MPDRPGPSTRSVHSGEQTDRTTGPIVPPLIANSAFHFADLDLWRSVAVHHKPGDSYSRNSNPTSRRLEKKVAALENAETALSFATGMAAISSTLFTLLSPGQRVVSVRDSYGATYLHFTGILPRFNIVCDLLDTDDHDAIESAVSQGCRLLYLETPTNPMLRILDLDRLTDAAQKAGAMVVVDNTFATPINQNPVEFGVDLVIHSATKYLCGHGDLLGGIVCGRNEIIREIYRFRELTGPSMEARSAHLLLRSLKTLGLRVERQNSNAGALARYLDKHPKVERVHYPGLESHEGHNIASKQMKGYGGVLSFELRGGMKATERFLPLLQYAYLAPNLGQVETIAGPAALTSHVELSDKDRIASGVPDHLIRYAVGIEDPQDLEADLAQALARI